MTASGGSAAEAQVAGDEGDFWTFSAQATIATLVASWTCVIWSALRQARLLNTALLVRTVERDIQTEHNPVACVVLREVNAITRRGSAKDCSTCRGMLLGGDVRVCIAYSEMDNEMENSMIDELERRESMALGPVQLSWGTQCVQVRASKRCNAVAKQVHTTCAEDATMNEGNQCLQRDVTGSRCLEEGCGKNMLDVCLRTSVARSEH